MWSQDTTELQNWSLQAISTMRPSTFGVITLYLNIFSSWLHPLWANEQDPSLPWWHWRPPTPWVDCHHRIPNWPWPLSAFQDRWWELHQDPQAKPHSKASRSSIPSRPSMVPQVRCRASSWPNLSDAKMGSKAAHLCSWSYDAPIPRWHQDQPVLVKPMKLASFIVMFVY